jgi:hypothetical protein
MLGNGAKIINELRDDLSVLDAMQRNESTTFLAYSETLLDRRVSPGTAKVLRHNLDDEYRHATWIRYERSRMRGTSQSGIRRALSLSNDDEGVDDASDTDGPVSQWSLVGDFRKGS